MDWEVLFPKPKTPHELAFKHLLGQHDQSTHGRPRPKEHGAFPEGGFGSVEEAKEWMAEHGASVCPGQEGDIDLDMLNDALRSLSEIPPKPLEAFRANGGSIVFVGGDNITNHPDLLYLRDVTPRGWSEEYTWSAVPGAYVANMKMVVVAPNEISGSRHGGVDLLLHETAHGIDRAMKNEEGLSLSKTPEWRERWSLPGIWPTEYEKKYPEEGFAEAFARRYTHHAGTRRDIPVVTEYLRQHLEEQND